MTQPTADLPSQTSPPAPLTLLALARARDERLRPLTGTAVLLYLLLNHLGAKGKYPEVANLTVCLDVHRVSLWRAEKALQFAHLLTLSMGGKLHSRRNWTYELFLPDRMSHAQKLAWESAVKPNLGKSDDDVLEAVEIVIQETPTAPTLAAAATDTTTRSSPAESPRAPEITEKKIELESHVAGWFLLKPENMDLYLRFGTDAYGKTQAECEAKLKPSLTDWLSFKLPAFSTWTPEVQASYLLYPYPKTTDGIWTHNHFAGYYWQGVCKWRAKHNIQLAFPHWGRLSHEIKNLLATTTPSQAYAFIFCIINYFDLVRFQAGEIGSSLMLDEAALNHKIICDKVQIIASHGGEWLKDEYEKMAQANQQTRR